MGGAVSGLNENQAAEVTAELRSRLEKYQAQNMPDDILREKMHEDCKSVIKSVLDRSPGSRRPSITATLAAANAAVDAAVSGNNGDALPNNEVKKKVHSNNKISLNVNEKATGNAKSTGKGPTRRRSFDTQNNGKKGGANLLQDPTLVSSGSTPALQKITIPSELVPTGIPASLIAGDHGVPTQPVEVVDSWDSVTQQPFCTTCQMAFKSASFLDRHVKFSDLHANNVKRKKELEEQGIAGTVPYVPPPKPDEPKQVEGEHYRMLYTGSKFFWRTSETIDLHIFYHVLPDCVEIVSYDVAKSVELARHYLDYSILLKVIKSQDLFEEAPDEDAQRTVITTYIIKRIQLEGTAIKYAHLVGDEEQKSAVLEKPPKELVPVVVTRRRRTNAEEIEATMSGITNDLKLTADATGRAERIAGLVHASADALSQKKWWADFNPVRRRWIWAIRRVIRQKLVAETKQNLIDREKQKL